MDINDIYGIIDKFDASGCSELNLEMNGVCLGLKKTMHEAICDVPVKKDIVRISTEQEQNVIQLFRTYSHSQMSILKKLKHHWLELSIQQQVLMRNLL